jgi:hypothetical protein
VFWLDASFRVIPALIAVIQREKSARSSGWLDAGTLFPGMAKVSLC